MTVQISSEDQKSVNDLRIDLAQLSIDLTELPVRDRLAKDHLFEQLRAINNRLDHLGIRHTNAQWRCVDGQA